MLFMSAAWTKEELKVFQLLQTMGYNLTPKVITAFIVNLVVFCVLVIPCCIIVKFIMIPQASLSLLLFMTFLSIFGGLISQISLIFAMGVPGLILFGLLQMAQLIISIVVPPQATIPQSVQIPMNILMPTNSLNVILRLFVFLENRVGGLGWGSLTVEIDG